MTDNAPSARDIAQRFGLKRYPRSWRGPCPACSYPGTFVLKEKAGHASMMCVNCRDDTAIRLAVRGPGPGAIRPKMNGADATAAALSVWNGAAAALGTLAETYLTGRGLSFIADSTALRFRRDCRHPEERGFWPAMVAVVVDAGGEPRACHRTYLRADGNGKAEIEPPKASKGPTWGCAIRLDPLAPEIVVGEEIETAASAGRLLGLPAWAAVSAANLGKGLVLPGEIRSVVIAADPDQPGEQAAREAALRWKAEGRQVRIARTNDAEHDFNDILLRRCV